MILMSVTGVNMENMALLLEHPRRGLLEHPRTGLAGESTERNDHDSFAMFGWPLAIKTRKIKNVDYFTKARYFLFWTIHGFITMSELMIHLLVCFGVVTRAPHWRDLQPWTHATAAKKYNWTTAANPASMSNAWTSLRKVLSGAFACGKRWRICHCWYHSAEVP